MKTASLLLTPALGLLAAGLACAPALAADVSITFEPGAETGRIMVALFDSQAGYDEGRSVRQAVVDVAAGQRTADFDGLPDGDYAVRAFHDVNGDGRMNTNPFGMPTEPYAFSNNARGTMGPAKWDQARFAAAGATAQTVSIK